MDICEVRSMVDLVNLYWQRDRNKNGKLEPNEIQGIKDSDKNGDGVLSPWEVMEAVNSLRPVKVFTPREISAMKKENESGKFYYLKVGKFRKLRLNIARPDSEQECRKLLKQLGRGRIEEPIKGLWVRFTDMSFTWRWGPLVCDTTIYGIKLKAGKDLSFSLSWTGKPTMWIHLHEKDEEEIDGIKYKSDLYFYIINQKRMKFVGGTLAEDVFIKTFNKQLKFKGGNELFFHDNEHRRVSRGVLAEGAVFDVGGSETKFKAGEVLGFHKNGAVFVGTLAEDKIIKGIACKAGTRIAFSERGQLTSITLPSDTSINNYNFKAGKEIKFDSKGRIISGILADDVELNGKSPAGQEFKIIFKGGEEIFFHDFKARNIRGGILAEDVTIGPATFKKGTFLDSYFGSDGKDRIKEGTLAKDAEISGQKYPAGATLKFSPQGKVLERVRE